MPHLLMPDTIAECLAVLRRDDLESRPWRAAIAADTLHALSQR
jgi:hypothetical protein